MLNFNKRKKKTYTQFLAKRITAKNEYIFIFVTYWVFKWWIKSNELTYICFIFFLFIHLFFLSPFEIVKRTHGDKCTYKSNEHFYCSANIVISIKWLLQFYRPFSFWQLKNRNRSSSSSSSLVKVKGKCRRGVERSGYNATLIRVKII